MFEEKAFRGNSANYYNPANSYIDQVSMLYTDKA
jgi:regulator of sirC expression with transglutaminase-like and TPR domain